MSVVTLLVTKRYRIDCHDVMCGFCSNKQFAKCTLFDAQLVYVNTGRRHGHKRCNACLSAEVATRDANESGQQDQLMGRGFGVYRYRLQCRRNDNPIT
jgi:hypothetical protein